jgi:hypothetical protein
MPLSDGTNDREFIVVEADRESAKGNAARAAPPLEAEKGMLGPHGFTSPWLISER